MVEWWSYCSYICIPRHAPSFLVEGNGLRKEVNFMSDLEYERDCNRGFWGGDRGIIRGTI